MVATHHRSVKVLGSEIFYREAGDPTRPTVLLLHGTPASSFMFRDLIPRLGERYHVVAPDMVGFGLSSAPSVREFDYTFDNLAGVTQAFLASQDIDRFAIYVQDYGAPIGWRLALMDPDRITAIISQNGNAYDEGFVQSFWEPLWKYGRDRSEANAAPLRQALSLDMIKWQYTHGVPDPTLVSPDTWHHDHAQVSEPGNLDLQLALFADYHSNVDMYPQVQEYFRNSQVPLLAVWGRNDQIFGPDGARAFERDLPGSEIHLLDGGHFLLESHLDEAAPIMQDFLARFLGK